MQRILHGFVQQDQTVLLAGVDMPRSLARDFHPMHSAMNAQQAWTRSLAGNFSERPFAKPLYRLG